MLGTLTLIYMAMMKMIMMETQESGLQEQILVLGTVIQMEQNSILKKFVKEKVTKMDSLYHGFMMKKLILMAIHGMNIQKMGFLMICLIHMDITKIQLGNGS